MPALIWEKLPLGELISPVVSVSRSSSPLAPQQLMLPFARSPQGWWKLAETRMNGLLECRFGLATVVASWCSVASWKGVGVHMVGVPSPVSGTVARAGVGIDMTGVRAPLSGTAAREEVGAGMVGVYASLPDAAAWDVGS